MDLSFLFDTGITSHRTSYQSSVFNINLYLKNEYRNKFMLPFCASPINTDMIKVIASPDRSASFTMPRFRKLTGTWGNLRNLCVGNKVYLMCKGVIFEFNKETHYTKLLLVYRFEETMLNSGLTYLNASNRIDIMNNVTEVMVDHREIITNHPKIAKLLPDIYSAAVNANKKVGLYNNLDSMLCDRFQMPSFATLLQRNEYILEKAELLLR